MPKQLMYVLPHCSTGGMPQYVLAQVREFKHQIPISVVEVNNYSDDYTVQRDALKKLCKFKQLHGNQDHLFLYLLEKQPDVIHFQELPETFLSETTLKKLYISNRKYAIVVTTHSSLTKGSDFRYYPDKIVAVNNWQKQLFEKELPSIPVDVWEYPIVETENHKADAKKALQFSPDTLHVLNIGLFTPGKNQAEIFHVANQLRDYPIKFHFVGNFAENFRDYWDPLFLQRSPNCVIWGEQANTDIFYQAADLFYFSSKFELNPLVVKEALSYRLPTLMRKLPTYLDDYDNNDLVVYIDDNINDTIEILKTSADVHLRQLTNQSS